MFLEPVAISAFFVQEKQYTFTTMNRATDNIQPKAALEQMPYRLTYIDNLIDHHFLDMSLFAHQWMRCKHIIEPLAFKAGEYTLDASLNERENVDPWFSKKYLLMDMEVRKSLYNIKIWK